MEPKSPKLSVAPPIGIGDGGWAELWGVEEIGD